MKSLILKLILLYQKTLSLDHGPLRVLRPYGQCKFYPTCSQYAYKAIETYGVLPGIVSSVKRILRCNPLSEGGDDLVIRKYG